MASPFKTVPAVKNPGTKEAMIAVAASQLGYIEGRNNDNAFGIWYGMNRQPWCAMFISWAASKSGCSKVIPKHAYTPAGAQWFKNRGQWGKTPRVGAIVYYDVSGLGRISHVGVVDKVFADGSWTAIEGNTNAAGSRDGGGVRRQKRRTVGTSRGGFGYPAYAKPPAAPKPPADSGWKTYTVKPGDYLGAIAQRHDTTVDKLVAKNAIRNPDVLAVGQKLQVPA